MPLMFVSKFSFTCGRSIPRDSVPILSDIASTGQEWKQAPCPIQLVEFIREHTGEHFHLEVAAYPEIHPQSKSYASDLHFFKQKINAGANSAITQYFYNPDAYFYYLDSARDHGINVPIYPGIMPITNYVNLARFSDACGAEIPRWIRKKLETYKDDMDSISAFGTELVTGMCETLLAGGAPGLHFYTMNQAEPTLALWENLGLD